MLVFALLFTLCTALYGCTASGAPTAENAVYTVVFRDGEETLATVSFKEGERLRESDFPALPEKQGYMFAGWFYEDKAIVFFRQNTIKRIRFRFLSKANS